MGEQEGSLNDEARVPQARSAAIATTMMAAQMCPYVVVVVYRCDDDDKHKALMFAPLTDTSPELFIKKELFVFFNETT